ncbi:MAG: hypothetical protein JXB23_08325, partial [Candidatus Aminicenantes bacterium]|nr:hypothetical protein [Candidatus Aminicenantes bacterium]
IPNLVVWKNFSPRLGFVYQLTEDGKTIIRGHYGRYVEFLSAGTFNSPGPYNPDFNAYYWDGSDWVNYLHVPGNLAWGVDPNLKAPYSDLFTIGIEREIVPDLSLGIQGVYKKTKNDMSFWNVGAIYEQVPLVSPDNGETYMVYNQTNLGANEYIITNPPDFGLTYKGIIIDIGKRYSHNWLLNASVSYSRSEGLGIQSTDYNNYQSSVIAHVGYSVGRDRNNYLNADGLMTNDRPWHFKLQFAYNFPFDILFGAHFQYMSGRPYIYYVRVYPDQGVRTIIAEPRNNDDRFDSISQLDLRLEKTFRIYNNVRFSAMVDVFNALNAGTVLYWASHRFYSSSYQVPSRMMTPRQFQIGLKIQF